MKNDSLVTSAAKLIATLPQEESRKYLSISLLVVLMFVGGTFYYLQTKSAQLIKSIVQARQLASRTDELIDRYVEVTREEDLLAGLLEKRNDYNNLRSYFERFCQQNKISPEAGWAETTQTLEIAGSDRFEEEQLTATFKKQKTRDIVVLIQTLEKDELLNLKELEIEKATDSLTAKITIAAKKFKKVLEE